MTGVTFATPLKSRSEDARIGGIVAIVVIAVSFSVFYLVQFSILHFLYGLPIMLGGVKAGYETNWAKISEYFNKGKHERKKDGNNL